jgi:hypothetical protein
VTRALRAGTADALCERVVDRVLRAGRDEVVAVEVVSERHDLDRFAPDEPLDRRRHVRCDVPR